MIASNPLDSTIEQPGEGTAAARRRPLRLPPFEVPGYGK